MAGDAEWRMGAPHTAAKRVEAVTGLGTDSDIVGLRMPPSTADVQACSRTVRGLFEGRSMALPDAD
jgi:hypothetical protein